MRSDTKRDHTTNPAANALRSRRVRSAEIDPRESRGQLRRVARAHTGPRGVDRRHAGQNDDRTGNLAAIAEGLAEARKTDAADPARTACWSDRGGPASFIGCRDPRLLRSLPACRRLARAASDHRRDGDREAIRGFPGAVRCL